MTAMPSYSQAPPLLNPTLSFVVIGNGSISVIFYDVAVMFYYLVFPSVTAFSLSVTLI